MDRAIERDELPEDTDSRLLVEMIVATIWFRSMVTRAPVDEALITSVVDIVPVGFGEDESDGR